MQARVLASSSPRVPTYPFILPAVGGGQAIVRARPHLYGGGDVPDRDNTESRESDEDAAWRDLIARFDAPTNTQQPVPWPEREDIPSPRNQKPQRSQGAQEAHRAEETRGTRRAESPDKAGGAQGARGTEGADKAERAQGARGTEGADKAEGPRGAREAEELRELGADRKRGGTPGGSSHQATRGGIPKGSGPDGTAGELGPDGTREELDAGGIRRPFEPEGIRGFDGETIRNAPESDGLQEAPNPDANHAPRQA